MPKQTKRGGLRNPPGGRPPTGITRIKTSPKVAQGTKELAQAIAKKQGYAGWGYAVDEAIKLLAAKLGITSV